MLLAITKKELERIETLIAPALVKKRYEKKVDGALLGFYCLIFSLLVIGIFGTGVILPYSLVSYYENKSKQEKSLLELVKA